MRYEYRWWYAVFIVASVIGLGTVFLLKPIFSHIAELKERERQLHKKIKQGQRLAKQYALKDHASISSPRAPSALLSDLIMYAQANGLMVLNAHFLPGEAEENSEVAKVKLMVQGNFLKLFLFLEALNQSRFPMVALDFSYEAKAEENFIFTANVAIFRQENPQFVSKTGEKIPQNPFCFALPFIHQRPENEGVKAPNFSIKTIKMTGYMEQEKRSQALLFLPDLTLVTASFGDVIGKEKAKVIEIQPHYVNLLLPNQERVLLKR